MHDNLEQEPDIGLEEQRRERRTQFLENGLSADYYNVILAFQHAAHEGDRDLLCKLCHVKAKMDFQHPHPIQTYRERYANDQEILTGLSSSNEYLVEQLDDIIERLNALLADPSTADLQQVAELCDEAQRVLFSNAEEEKKVA